MIALWLFDGLPYFNSEQLYHKNARDQSYPFCILALRSLTQEKHLYCIVISSCCNKIKNVIVFVGGKRFCCIKEMLARHMENAEYGEFMPKH